MQKLRGSLGMKSGIEDSTSTNEKNKIKRRRHGIDMTTSLLFGT